jgi:electron transfer flavoprotein beta subunit
VAISRITEAGVDLIEASFPALISVVEKINEPRYPSFKGIMAAKKKTITTMSLADTGLAASNVGSSAAWSTVKDALPRPPRGAGIKLTDEGSGGEKLVEFLVEKRLA